MLTEAEVEAEIEVEVEIEIEIEVEVEVEVGIELELLDVEEADALGTELEVIDDVDVLVVDVEGVCTCFSSIEHTLGMELTNDDETEVEHKHMQALETRVASLLQFPSQLGMVMVAFVAELEDVEVELAVVVMDR